MVQYNPVGGLTASTCHSNKGSLLLRHSMALPRTTCCCFTLLSPPALFHPHCLRPALAASAAAAVGHPGWQQCGGCCCAVVHHAAGAKGAEEALRAAGGHLHQAWAGPRFETTSPGLRVVGLSVAGDGAISLLGSRALLLCGAPPLWVSLPVPSCVGCLDRKLRLAMSPNPMLHWYDCDAVVVQFIASAPTLFPAAYVEEFQGCLDRTPAVPFERIREIVRTDLGRPIEDVFASIDPTPLASASIAQASTARPSLVHFKGLFAVQGPSLLFDPAPLCTCIQPLQHHMRSLMSRLQLWLLLDPPGARGHAQEHRDGGGGEGGEAGGEGHAQHRPQLHLPRGAPRRDPAARPLAHLPRESLRPGPVTTLVVLKSLHCLRAL